MLPEAIPNGPEIFALKLEIVFKMRLFTAYKIICGGYNGSRRIKIVANWKKDIKNSL